MSTDRRRCWLPIAALWGLAATLIGGAPAAPAQSVEPSGRASMAAQAGDPGRMVCRAGGTCKAAAEWARSDRRDPRYKGTDSQMICRGMGSDERCFERGVWEATAGGTDGGRGSGSQAGGRDGGGGTAASGRRPGGEAGEPGGDDEGPSAGQVDSFGIQGIGSPICKQPGARAERRVREACERTGSPETAFPVSNYGLDINIDTDTDIGPVGVPDDGVFFWLIAQIVNMLWLGLLFVFKLIFTGLSWAFTLNPFGDNGAMGGIERAAQNIYRVLGSPWVLTMMVVVGAVVMWRGLVQRQAGSAIGQMALTIVLMLLALWITLQPEATVGRLAKISNDFALGAIAAPQGKASNPSGGYAEALNGIWEQTVRSPFAALDFSDSEWAEEKASAGAIAAASQSLCADVGFDAALVSCVDDVERMLGSRPTNIDLYLVSSPGSQSRQDLWEHNYEDRNAVEAVAIQGKEGALTRIPLLIMVVLALLGVVLLLGWLALRLFVQSSIAVILTLLAPIALFMPAFGPSGQRAFYTWGTTLLGALVSKAVYALLLAVVIAGSGVMSKLAGESAIVSFLLTSGFCWAGFLKRSSIVAWASISRDGGEAAGDVRGLAGAYAAMRLGQGVTRAVGKRMPGGAQAADGRGAGGLRGRALDGIDDDVGSAAEVAGERLDQRAGELAEHEYREAAANATRIPQLEDDIGRATTSELARYDRAVASGADRRAAFEGLSSGAQRDWHEREGYRRELAGAERSRDFVERADRRQAETGERWERAELDRYRERVRAAADDPGADHSWRRTASDPEALEAELDGDRRAFRLTDAERDMGSSRGARVRASGGFKRAAEPAERERIGDRRRAVRRERRHAPRRRSRGERNRTR